MVTLFLRGVAALTTVLAWPGAHALTIGPGQGVRFFQHDHVSAAQTVNNTGIGSVVVDLNQLRKRSGLASGFVNVSTSKGWVVRNLPVLAEEVYPYSKISAELDLGVSTGVDLLTLSASVDYSASVKTAYFGVVESWDVEPLTLSIGGAGTVAVTGPPSVPNLTDILFGDPTNNDTVTQFDHPNIEAAQNQCMPTSVANSLQFLKDTTGLQLPHEHKPGLKPSVSAGDTSLVGQLEEAMGRSVTDRRHGAGVWGLQGKLKYLAQNNLAGSVSVKHWGSGDSNSGASNASATVGGVTATSKAGGTAINFDALLEAMREGQNCELVYSWPTGAHAVDLVAAGKTNGRPWLVHGSDLNQGSDTDGAGPSGFRFEHLSDPDQNGLLNLSGTDKEVVQVICEKYDPPPASVTVIETADPAGHSCCVSPPPATIVIETSGSTLRMSGNASWLPLVGMVSATGSFDLASSSTVAGFNNVKSRFVGTHANGSYDGTVTIGTQGELFGVPISYRVRVTDAPAPVRPAIRVNGFRTEAAAQVGEMLKVSISMKAGQSAGQAGDWWLVMLTAEGQWYNFDLLTMAWKPGLAALYSGSLFSFPYFGLPTLDGLPAGTHSFFFAYDGVPNGALDGNSLVYNRTTLTVRP
jgi:hypothetical protein